MNILILIHDDAGNHARVRCGLDLARALSARITCLDVTRLPLPIADYVDAAGRAICLAEEASRERALSERIRAALADSDLPWNWIDMAGTMKEALENRIDAADITVLSTSLPPGELPEMTELVSGLVLSSRRLIVVAPPDAPGFPVSGPALIAWDGSAPARHAVELAAPLLRKASAVTLFTVDDGGDEAASMDRALMELAAVGIAAGAERHHNGVMAPDFHIRDRCRAGGFGYCVMGAYGHSRRLESWFGGVTRRMIAKSPVPLILAH